MMEDVHTLLWDSGLGHLYWAEAAAFSVATQNLIPSHHHSNKVLLESFSSKCQGVYHLRVFGCKYWAKIPTVHGSLITGESKLDSRGIECVFLRYVSDTGNYKVQDATSHCVLVSHDIVFKEGLPHHTSPIMGEQTLLFDTLDETNMISDSNGTTTHITPEAAKAMETARKCSPV